MFENLTVFETLLYSARLRLGGGLSRKEKIMAVDRVIAQLGLEGNIIRHYHSESLNFMNVFDDILYYKCFIHRYLNTNKHTRIT